MFVRVPLDKTLISSKNDTEHLNNMSEVLNVTQTNGLVLKVTQVMHVCLCR